ncbi:hypothetical protein BC830DRAFT_208817 [Chytriomyces sp. MP71]|nr:hypothetical protein BC830DRAFT_208817 [Chytriomyces sp. MP71]
MSDCILLEQAFPGIERLFAADPTNSTRCCGAMQDNSVVVGCDNDGRVTYISYDGHYAKPILQGTLAPLQGLSQLERIRVPSNNITGPMPATITQWKFLALIDLGNNPLSGRIPELGDLPFLSKIYLSDLRLSGELPKTFPAITQYINSGISGTIPASIAALSQLNVLSLQNNSLTGEIPASWASSALISAITLGNNHFSGTIPPLGNLANLNTLDLSHNALSGSIPTEFLKLTANSVNIDLSYNFLTGMPDNLTGGVAKVDISFNCISGQPSIRPDCTTQTTFSSSLTIGLASGGSMVFIIALAVSIVVWNRRQRRIASENLRKNKEIFSISSSAPLEGAQSSTFDLSPESRSIRSSIVIVPMEKEAITADSHDLVKASQGLTGPTFLNILASTGAGSTATALHALDTKDDKKESKNNASEILSDFSTVHPSLWTVEQASWWCSEVLQDTHLETLILDQDITGSMLVNMSRADFSSQFGLVFGDALALEDALTAIMNQQNQDNLPSYD